MKRPLHRSSLTYPHGCGVQPQVCRLFYWCYRMFTFAAPGHRVCCCTWIQGDGEVTVDACTFEKAMQATTILFNFQPLLGAIPGELIAWAYPTRTEMMVKPYFYDGVAVVKNAINSHISRRSCTASTIFVCLPSKNTLINASSRLFLFLYP